MKGRKPELAADPSAVDTIIAPPSWLSKFAKAEWRRVMPILSARRILTEADIGGLENCCTASGQVREMQKIIAREGSVIQTERGLRAHPAVRIQADAMTRACGDGVNPVFSQPPSFPLRS